jgi:hypothetical protein
VSHDPAEVSRGLAHGFEFTGNLPIVGLRAGSAPLVTVEPGTVGGVEGRKVGEWDEIPGKRAHVTVIETEPGRYTVTVGSMGRFLVDTTARHIDAEFRGDLPSIIRTTVLMSTPAALLISHAGKTALHAGAVEVGGRALLLSAEGSGGKTTLTAAFHIAGHRILSEDLSAVDPTGFVDPAPALLRLRPEAAARIGADLTGATQLWEGSDRRLYEITQERRGDGQPVQLAAVVLLGWSDEGTSIEPVPPARAIQELWRKAFYLSRETGASTCFEQLATLVETTPVYKLLRPRDFGLLDATVSRLVEELVDHRGAR